MAGFKSHALLRGVGALPCDIEIAKYPAYVYRETNARAEGVTVRRDIAFEQQVQHHWISVAT
jgi:hypothetical protein